MQPDGQGSIETAKAEHPASSGDALKEGTAVPGARRARASARRFAIGVLLCTAFGGALRCAVMEATFPAGLVGDEIYYLKTAASVAQGQGHYSPMYGSRAAWPPAFPYFLSHFVRFDPSDPELAMELKPLLRVQVALGTLVVALAALLARALFDARTGILAGVIVALYPTLIAYSHFFWSETFFAALLTGALLGVVVGQRRRSLWLAGALGLVFGVAGLTREVGLVIAGLCALWWGVTAPAEMRRLAAARGALLLLCAALVVLPWTVRNYGAFGRLIPVSTAGWLNLRSGNTLGGPTWLRPDLESLREFRNRYWAVADEMERMQLARREAAEQIRAEQPAWIFKKLVRTTGLLFSPDSFLFKKISRGTYGEVPPGRLRALLLVTAGAYVLVVLAAVPAIAAAPGPGRRLLPTLLFAVVFALHVLANASSRYRLPLMPLLVAYASYGLLHPRSVRARLSGRPRLASLLVLLVFAGFCIPYFYPEAVSLWTRGTYMDLGRP